MSLTFNMVGGGSGGESGGMPLSNAIIHVKAPYGSTITFSKGGVVVKTLAPGKAHPNGDGVSADYYFSVSPSNYGTWTITATKDIYTSAETIGVNAAHQYDVIFIPELRVITAGVRDQSIGIILQHMAETQGNGFLLYKQSLQQNPEYVSFGPVDISPYSTLNWRMSVAGLNTAYANAYGIGQNHGTTLVMSNSMNAISRQTVKTYTQDISHYTGEYYITAFVESSGNVPQISIYDLWLK